MQVELDLKYLFLRLFHLVAAQPPIFTLKFAEGVSQVAVEWRLVKRQRKGLFQELAAVSRQDFHGLLHNVEFESPVKVLIDVPCFALSRVREL